MYLIFYYSWLKITYIQLRIMFWQVNFDSSSSSLAQPVHVQYFAIVCTGFTQGEFLSYAVCDLSGHCLTTTSRPFSKLHSTKRKLSWRLSYCFPLQDMTKSLKTLYINEGDTTIIFILWIRFSIFPSAVIFYFHILVL